MSNKSNSILENCQKKNFSPSENEKHILDGIIWWKKCQKCFSTSTHGSLSSSFSFAISSLIMIDWSNWHKWREGMDDQWPGQTTHIICLDFGIFAQIVHLLAGAILFGHFGHLASRWAVCVTRCFSWLASQPFAWTNKEQKWENFTTMNWIELNGWVGGTEEVGMEGGKGRQRVWMIDVLWCVNIINGLNK